MGQLGRVVELDQGHLPGLQALFERSASFIQQLHGEGPRRDEAERWLLEPPPGKAPEDRRAFGLVDDEERLIGAVDVVRDHPAPGEFWLGTMVIEPTIRGIGLGAWFHGQVLAWIRGQGARGVQLCVQRQNVGAVRFWLREGYQETGTQQVLAGKAPQEVLTMRLEL